ncbi:MAG: Zn-finger DNA-binding domain protein [Firmicutes bacterium]|nr:Zn-finger DNA-binding domain protein [Bacillota bacterium]
MLLTLEEILVLGLQVRQVEQEVKEFRFFKGKVCPLCGHGNYIKKW